MRTSLQQFTELVLLHLSLAHTGILCCACRRITFACRDIVEITHKTRPQVVAECRMQTCSFRLWRLPHFVHVEQGFVHSAVSGCRNDENREVLQFRHLLPVVGWFWFKKLTYSLIVCRCRLRKRLEAISIVLHKVCRRTNVARQPLGVSFNLINF